MGEYLTIDGAEAKLGTCEHAMYLRRDDAHRLAEVSTDSYLRWAVTTDQENAGAIFRFPWPDEDPSPGETIADVIGRTNDHDPFPYHDRPAALVAIPAELAPPAESHGLAQVRPASNGDGHNLYTSIPCPLGQNYTGGPRWSLRIIGERESAPHGLRTVVECAWCRHLYSLTAEQARAVRAGMLAPDELRGRVIGIGETPVEVAEHVAELRAEREAAAARREAMRPTR